MDLEKKNPPIAPRDPEDAAKKVKERIEERRRLRAAMSPYARLDIPEGEKPDLFEYLAQLPDIEGDIPPLPEDEKGDPEAPPEEKSEEQQKIEALADRIREHTRASQVIAYSVLFNEDNGVAELLDKLVADEAYSDIVSIKGQKDVYYYSDNTMTRQYADIAVLVEEQNYTYTVARMVRYHSEIHPAPTCTSYFTSQPYSYPKPLMKQVRDALKSDPEYADIQEFQTSKGNVHFFSTKFMSLKYARALAELSEEED